MDLAHPLSYWKLSWLRSGERGTAYPGLEAAAAAADDDNKKNPNDDDGVSSRGPSLGRHFLSSSS